MIISASLAFPPQKKTKTKTNKKKTNDFSKSLKKIQ